MCLTCEGKRKAILKDFYLVALENYGYQEMLHFVIFRLRSILKVIGTEKKIFFASFKSTLVFFYENLYNKKLFFNIETPEV